MQGSESHNQQINNNKKPTLTINPLTIQVFFC